MIACFFRGFVALLVLLEGHAGLVVMIGMVNKCSTIVKFGPLPVALYVIMDV